MPSQRASGLRLRAGVSALALMASPAMAAPFDPYPVPVSTNAYGGIGLLQNPTARFAPDGQFTVGYNEVAPYSRYFLTMQAMPWMEATLRYTSVADRLYSADPDFSGDQTYKDRGFDVKLRVLTEGRIRPALAIGGRDFLGTGLFSSEYIVASKSFGPIDATFGIGWGKMATRAHIRNPLTYVFPSFASRGGFDGGTGGSFSNVYFRGPKSAFFGGIQYATPIRGLTLKAEYDPNNYQAEALGNNQPVKSAINIGADYRILPWLHAQASFERGNRFGITVTATTNFHRQTVPPKFELPATPVAADTYPIPDIAPVDPALRLSAPAAIGVASLSSTNPVARRPVETVIPGPGDLETRLVQALDIQGTALYSADFKADSVDLFVAQTRFRNVAMGVGRVARAAFAVLPAKYEHVTVVLVENGVETMAVKVPRAGLIEAIAVRRGPVVDKLLDKTTITVAPLTLDKASFKGPVKDVYPQLLYSVRPGLKTTIGRPEQFVLYQAFVALNGGVLLGRGLEATGQFTVNVSNNFDKLKVQSNSVLPRVRSNISEYLREGTTAISHLQTDYNFNIAPGLYGHVYGGLLEEMFAGVGGEMLYRPPTQNWAVGVDLNYVRQRDFNQFFGMQDYTVLTGHVGLYLHLPKARIDASARVGRYLAKDYGVTFDVARTFDSGVRVGAFTTFTNVSAADFGEGSFDKGIYLIVPLDLLYNKHVRSSVGVLYRPLIRDGGQQLVIRQPLINTTDIARKANLIYNWQAITN